MSMYPNFSNVQWSHISQVVIDVQSKIVVGKLHKGHKENNKIEVFWSRISPERGETRRVE